MLSTGLVKKWRKLEFFGQDHFWVKNLTHFSTKPFNSSFLFFQRHLLKCSYTLYVLFSLYFYHSWSFIWSIILLKWLCCFNDKTPFLHDFYVMRPLFWLSTIVQKSQKCFKGGVSLPHIGSLCVKSGTESLAQSTHGSHIVLTPPLDCCEWIILV